MIGSITFLKKHYAKDAYDIDRRHRSKLNLVLRKFYKLLSCRYPKSDRLESVFQTAVIEL